jgi:hypothetical protein
VLFPEPMPPVRPKTWIATSDVMTGRCA